MSNPWLLRFGRRDAVTQARPRLYAFPCAGGGASAYRTWSAGLPAFDVVGVQPPGRENRLREAPLTSVNEMACAAADAISSEGQTSFVFVGHSFGALVAFETTRELRRRGHALPSRLVVSARPAPHLRAGLARDGESLHDASDACLVKAMQEAHGLPGILATNPEYLALFLPVLRADLQAIANHKLLDEPKLPCPIVAVAADRDPLASLDAVAAWEAYTEVAFSFHVLAGGHFYFRERDGERQLLALLAA